MPTINFNARITSAIIGRIQMADFGVAVNLDLYRSFSISLHSG